jgi:23S rRNA (cytosine1962-C5)-methyltransferase
MRVLELSPGREASVRRRHPWLFSGAIRRRSGHPDGLAEVRNAAGFVVARGLDCPGSALEARLWTFGDTPFDLGTYRRRFARAKALREGLPGTGTTGYRLLHSEGDETPGVIADRYADTDVLLLTAEGAVLRRGEIETVYHEVFAPRRLIVRAEGEGLETIEPVRFSEYGLLFRADVSGGQKTGFFLDQRENRRRIRERAAGKTVLNLFSYSGGFSVAALAGGARRAVDVDSSAAALALARSHRGDNGLPVADEDFVAADVFQDLRARTAAAERWDVVVSDPPAFARKKSDVDRAARGYKDVLRLAMEVTAPGGLLLACSCSGLVSADLFQKIVFAASVDSGARFQLLERAGAGIDHPVAIDCPESEYLKAFYLRRTA